MSRVAPYVLLGGLLLGVALLYADLPPKMAETTAPANTQPVMPEKLKKLQKRLTNLSLNGQYTMTGQDGAQGPDSYVIKRARWNKGDSWTLFVYVAYGRNDLTVPIPVDIVWAGDTPVITIDNVGIPLMGKYSARVMLYKNQYAGVWQGARIKGEIWGTLKNLPAKKPATQPATQPALPAE